MVAKPIVAVHIVEVTAELRDHLQTALTGAYVVEREIAGGGMSRVFVAEERALGRRVVVKVLSPELAAGVNVERFRREIQLTARLQHPHIVPILSAGEMDGLPFYTMPLVEGESLRVRLVRAGALPVALAVSILRDVARALDFAHEKGVVHRDIKPDNILLAGDSAAVSDFGIAKAIAASRLGDDEALTQLGMALGTPHYMAPEQIAADPAIDHRADLYSLGCVAYEMLAGETPFAGRAPTALFKAHLLEQPARITSKRADVPDTLEVVISRCLAKDPATRPPSARDVLALLDRTSAAVAESTTAAIPVREALTIVVLPFVNLDADAEGEHFADGLTDEVITDLSMLKMLRVTSRQSAMRLKGSDKDVRTIARELGTRYVLTGGIRRAGGLSEHGDARLRLAEITPEVNADAVLLEVGEVFTDPSSGDRRAALATDRCRHAFLQLVLGEPVARQDSAGLIHHVDPTRAHVLAGRVDLFFSVRGDLADLGEPSVANADVGENPWIAFAVEHTTVPNDDVVDRVCGRA